MNNNQLTQQTLAFISANFQLVKFEVLNVDPSSQNIGTIAAHFTTGEKS